MPHARTRQRLIEQATIAFLADGYGATSLDRIAKAAKVAKKTIYRLIGSKAQLFVAVVDQAMRAIPADGLRAATDDADPEAALRAFLTACAELGLSEAGLRLHWMILREAPNFPELIPAFRQTMAGFSHGLAGWIAAQNARGWLRVADPARSAAALMTLLLEEVRRDHMLGLRAAPDAAERAAIVDFTLTLFLNGARRPSGNGPSHEIG